MQKKGPNNKQIFIFVPTVLGDHCENGIWKNKLKKLRYKCSLHFSGTAFRSLQSFHIIWIFAQAPAQIL